jgi:hypothetical protein
MGCLSGIWTAILELGNADWADRWPINADWKHSRIVSLDHYESKMLGIRLYISVLTLTFLILVVASRGLGVLEGVVISCALVYLILDAREELQIRKADLRLLQDIEQHLSKFLRLNS